VPFVWHDGEALVGEGELELGTEIANYWTNFAATGDPNLRKSSAASRTTTSMLLCYCDDMLLPWPALSLMLRLCTLHLQYLPC
jgi:hypothetical protein